MYFSCTMCGSRGFLFAVNRIFATSTYWLIVWAFFMSKHHWKCLSRSLLFPSLSSFEGSEFGDVIYFDQICYLYRLKLPFVPIAALICLHVLISMPNGFSVDFRFVLRMNDFIQKFNFLVVWVQSIHFYIFFWPRNFKWFFYAYFDWELFRPHYLIVKCRFIELSTFCRLIAIRTIWEWIMREKESG